MPDHPLADAKLSLEWAKSEINDFQAAIDQHFARKPYVPFTDRHAKPGRVVQGIKFTEPIPTNWKRHVRQFASHCRPPLDYAMVAVGRELRAEKADLFGMPIEPTEERFESEMKKRKIEGRCPDLGRFLRNVVKPYEGSNDLIVGLHEISRADKHRKLVTIAMSGGLKTFRFGYIFSGDGSGFRWGASEWEAAKDRFVFVERPADSEFHGNVEIALHVALSQLKGFEREPVTAVFVKMVSAVENILSQFERQFFS
jgi:hypothetical protein